MENLVLAAPHPNAYDWTMQISRAKPDELAGAGFEGGRGLGVLRVILALAWDIVRLPVLTFLVIVEPLVQFFLSAIALLLALTAIFFKFVVHRADFPFWEIALLSIGCVWVLALYYAIIRMLGLRGAVGPDSTRAQL